MQITNFFNLIRLNENLFLKKRILKVNFLKLIYKQKNLIYLFYMSNTKS